MAVQQRIIALAIGAIVALAACGDDVHAEPIEQAIDAVGAANSLAETPVPASSAPETTTTTILDTSTTSSTTTTTTTTTPVVVPELEPNEIHIEPAGPYEDGQSITLYADAARRIDLYNASPRVCVVSGEGTGSAEWCGVETLRPKPISRPPGGTQAVNVELQRALFGPGGPVDCGAPELSCRIIWRNEAGEYLRSEALTFNGELVEPLTRLNAEVTSEPGVVRIDTTGMDFDEALESFPESQLATIAEIIDEFGEFDQDRLKISWSVGSVCGFGTRSGPIGSKGLVDAPSWWNFRRSEAGQPLHFFGPTCDWNAASGSLDDIDQDGILQLHLRRNIYGYGGWVDCAASTCFVTLEWSWRHPEPEGRGTIGGSGAAFRIAVDVPETWSSAQPEISIEPPGPYEVGQSVTVEAKGLEGEGTALGWCPGGDGYCSWKFADVEDGVASVQWTILGTAESCGLSRCYFALDSASEGLAPPAIAIAPIVER